MCIVDSDNCRSQNKSAQHFEGIQYLYNQFNISIICLFSNAEHGKGEVDHAVGLAKCAIRLVQEEKSSMLQTVLIS